MSSIRRVVRAAWGAVALLVLLSPHLAHAQSRPASPAMPTVERNLLETLASHPEFTTLLRYVRRAGLADTLAASGPFTMFAPTNVAFARMPARITARWQRDRAQLRMVLLRHLLVGSAFRHHVVGLRDAVMVSGDTILLRPLGQTMQLDSRATVTAWSLRASNGAVHTIDRVLLPTPRRTGAVAARGPNAR